MQMQRMRVGLRNPEAQRPGAQEPQSPGAPSGPTRNTRLVCPLELAQYLLSTEEA